MNSLSQLPTDHPLSGARFIRMLCDKTVFPRGASLDGSGSVSAEAVWLEANTDWLSESEIPQVVTELALEALEQTKEDLLPLPDTEILTLESYRVPAKNVAVGVHESDGRYKVAVSLINPAYIERV